MTHPHQSMLEEFQFAIKHFVPMLPEEMKREAQKIHDEIAQNTALDEAAIKEMFYPIGLSEFPYRRAYQELIHSGAEAQMKQMVLEHVDETVRKVIKPHIEAGVSLEELVESDLFAQELDVAQQYQVEDGISVAKNKLAENLQSDVGDQAKLYQSLVEKWTAHAEELKNAIDALEQFAQGGTENQQAEIKQKVAQFREGFLITQPDPVLEEVQKEKEYWKDIFAEEEA